MSIILKKNYLIIIKKITVTYCGVVKTKKKVISFINSVR